MKRVSQYKRILLSSNSKRNGGHGMVKLTHATSIREQITSIHIYLIEQMIITIVL